MIPAIKFYELYNAIYLTYKGKYDCFKYNFKFRVTQEKYMSHKMKWAFMKWSQYVNTEQQAIDFIFSNIYFGNDYIVKFNDENYKKLRAYQESLIYFFERDTEKYLSNGFKDLRNDIQEKIDMQEFDEITYFVILNYISKNAFLNKLKKEMGDNLLFEDFEKRVLTTTPFYASFMKIDSLSGKDTRVKLVEILKNINK